MIATCDVQMMMNPGCHFPTYSVTGLFSDGDVILGGIFPFHDDAEFEKITFTIEPAPINCRRTPSQTYQGLQAMMFAVEEINHNNYLLPNTTLGFQIYDSCRVNQRSLQATLWMLTGQEKPVLNFCCQRELPLMGIIGDAGSSSSIVMARILGLYKFPQISYVSTSPLLSNRNQFPSFFRTITNDDLQAQGLAQLLVHFGWTWVGILVEDNDYGQQGYHLIKQELAKAGACIAFSENIILSRADRNALHIIQVIKNSTAKAIVIFSSDAGLVPLIDQMIVRNVSGKVFIASEGWSTSATLAIEKYNEFLSGTIGIGTHSGEIPGFKEYLDAINPVTSPDNVFLPEFWEDVFNCKWPPQKNATTFWDNESKLCTGHERIGSLQVDFNDGTNLRSSYNVYNAVYASAWSLHDLIFCKSHKDLNSKTACADINNFKPWQLLHYVKNVHFQSKSGEEIFFNQNGEVPVRYDIVSWQQGQERGLRQMTVGSYDSNAPHGQTIKVNTSGILWVSRASQWGNAHTAKGALMLQCLLGCLPDGVA
ncbi:hypothetical protein NDU88_000634 [Pleurodeles waltl]|uniref:Receptor ligand binding region domain-containing protein n=1 Tax=Pleurodeles waltl TaxID=8319 RepID=A0AAV7KNB3_PLEWA|nr:hypothetical protein NDU88_000634 [Pleurodeles waltl]